jgi:hypothetical protein
MSPPCKRQRHEAEANAADQSALSYGSRTIGSCRRRSSRALRHRLEEFGIAHEIVDAHFGSGLAFRNPDNIALEFFAPGTQ